MRLGLCGQCAGSIVREKGETCNVCGKPLVSEIGLCMGCRNSGGHSYDRLWTLFPYTGKYRSLLKAYKFNKTLSLADFFSEHILALIAENPELADAVIAPVPPRPGKIKENGWDQVEYLVRRLAKSGKAPPVNACLKRRVSKVQKRLSRAERIENLKGRIFVNKTVPKTVLVIDDVITTGSTMEACAAVLKQNGAERVYGLCLFYD
jgi:ComF family protein